MRIVLRGLDARNARPLRERLDAAGLAVTSMAGVAARAPAPAGEDLTLVDARDPDAAIAFSQSLVGKCAALMRIGLGAAAPTPETARMLDAWVCLDAPPEAMRRRIASIYRDGVMTAEIEARERTAAALGLAIQPANDEPARPPAALFVGAATPAFLPFERAFARCGGRAAATFTSFAAFDHLHDESFDALVLHGGEDPGASLSLIAALRRNARLYDMPAFLFSADEGIRAEALARGADDAIDERHDVATSAGWLAEDIRRARRRRALTRALQAPLAAGVEAFAVFGFHLAGLAQSHHDFGRPLAIAILEIAGGRNVREEAWRRGFSEIAALSARLVRAADTAAPVDARRIAFAFPSTEQAGAETAMKRVIGVCECTAFAAGDGGGEPLTFRARTAELSPGESGAGLLSRTLRERAA